MAGDTPTRIEARLSLTHGGQRATPEYIRELDSRRALAERAQARGAPGAFGRVLAASQTAAPPAALPAREGPPPRPSPQPGGPRPAGLDGDLDRPPALQVGPVILRG